MRKPWEALMFFNFFTSKSLSKWEMFGDQTLFGDETFYRLDTVF